jgi:transcriptional regulator with PAS, ATPase and Fis domain
MTKLNLLEREVKYYKRGLDSVLSATYSFDSILGKNRLIIEAKKFANKYAKTDGAVLILGATGSGKELFAHAIHQASWRRSGSFVCVNCAAIPRELLESELFGYETGAFTGARPKGKAGKIELAHGGSLFLDELGDLPLNAQAKLLRVLETKKIERLGGVNTVKVDFRLIAATNRDLREMIDRNEFREDLFYRLNTMSVIIPSLSERPEDIADLMDHFLASHDRPNMRFSRAATKILQEYQWPGNIRELKNVVERAVSLAEGNVIGPEHLPSEIINFKPRFGKQKDFGLNTLSREVADFERDLIGRAISLAEGNMVKAAKLLGISRSTLYEKCKKHEI